MVHFKTALPAYSTRTFLKIGLIGGSLLASGLAWSQNPSSAIPSGPLVSTEWLASNLENPNIRIVEVSVNPGVYERGHIPGAVNFSWHTAVSYTHLTLPTILLV